MKSAILFNMIITGAVNLVFTFVAFGDMPYRVPNDYPKFERVIKTLNQEKPDFIVHVGDFKSGSSPVTLDRRYSSSAILLPNVVSV